MKASYLLLIFTLGVAILLVLSENSMANDIGESSSSELSGASIDTNQKCQEIWDSIWPLIEEGNIKSRAKLLGHMYANHLELPGRSGDYLSRIRDFTIVLAHSAGAMKTFDDLAPWQSYLTNLPGNDDFFECMKQSPSKQCTEILVNQKAVPPFDNFVQEVNALVASGKEPNCTFLPKDTKIDPPENTKSRKGIKND